jgi:hypothetical protein
MELNDIKTALDNVKNLVVVDEKVYLLRKVDLSRPKNSVVIATLESGKEYICAPANVRAVIGTVEVEALPFARLSGAGDTGSPSAEDRILRAPVVVDGVSVAPGERVRTRKGEVVTFLGHLPKGQKYPYAYKNDNGRIYKADRSFFLSKVG